MSSRLDELPLICPHDGRRLHRSEGALRCPAGHAFDIARQGYVNLLPVAHKASRHPGDSAQMVQARARVMDSGLFEPVAAALGALVTTGSGLIVDSGCGDGWFTQGLVSTAADRPVLALDVSKDAIRATARRQTNAVCLVASGRALPVSQGQIDTLLCVFGFPFWHHWAEWQSPGQKVITVDPGPDHLLELREAIYPDVRRHPAPEHEQALSNGYRLAHTEVVEDNTGQVRAWIDLLDMTPHGRRCTSVAREQLAQREPGVVRIDVVLRVYEREVS
jgi:23S rRNA (guanine745-N1)-methyltransferase